MVGIIVAWLYILATLSELLWQILHTLVAAPETDEMAQPTDRTPRHKPTVFTDRNLSSSLLAPLQSGKANVTSF